jgi:hypothetical protein
MRKAKFLSEQLDETLNGTLIRWIVELNYPGASIPRLKRNFTDLEQREDPVKTVQILTQLQAVGYQPSDLDWLRDKLQSPSLERVEMEPSMSEPQTADAGESETGKVIGESTIGRMLSSTEPISTDNLDFSEFDESGDLKDETVRDKVAKKISDRFNTGGMDEVGWDRLSAGISGSDIDNSKLNIDEFTTPGDIIYTTKRLLDEIRSIPRTIPDGHDRLRMELVRFENIALRGEDMDEREVADLVRTYTLAYRLNRSHVHRELVNFDPEKLGYWSSFSPYYL